MKLPAVVLGCLTIFAALPLIAADWPQWRGPQRDGVWRETGIIDRFQSEKLEPVWSVPIGAGYSGPTVADGRVFVSDRLVEPKQVERIHCFDEESGKNLWTVTYPCIYTISYTAGPRASITIDNDRAYALGAMADLHCLDTATGKILWKRDLEEEYAIEMPIWGIAGAPLVVGDRLILHIGGADGACVVALNKMNGQELWRALDDRAQYSAPVLTKQGGKQVVVVWTGDSVAGLAPENGDVYWRHELKPREMPIGVATPVIDDGRLLVTSFYDGSLMLRLYQDSPDAEVLWRRVGVSEQQTDALHSIISTPLLDGDYVYGVDSYGELRCLEAETGDRIWESDKATPPARWSTIHFTPQGDGDRVWMFNERGELIIARLSPQGYEEIDRAALIEPTDVQLPQRGGVTWAHPAYANKHIFVRNDERMIRVNLAQ